jgi:hypothetical protein
VLTLLQRLKGEGAASQPTARYCPEFFAHSIWAERRPSLAQAVTAPLICWSFSSPMFRYLLVDHPVPDGFSLLSHRQAGDRTFAGLLLAVLLGVAMQAMRIACFALLAGIGVVALARRRWHDERMRSDALIILVGVFALFYGLPQFSQSFSFAPTDMTLFAFVLFVDPPAWQTVENGIRRDDSRFWDCDCGVAGTAWPMRIEVHFLAIGLMPILWYLMFTNHTALHSSYMVRPLTLNVALAAIILTLVPVEVRRKPAETARA